MPDTDLEAMRKRVAEKRNKLAEARMNRASTEAEVHDALQAVNLQAEEARLDRELEAAVEASKPANIKAANASNLDAAKAALAAHTGKAAEKLPKDGSTVEKPKGVNLETGELLPEKEREKQATAAANSADETKGSR